jgi:hypothetical protein
VIVGMCPEINRQFGRSETRSQEIDSNLMVMTYNSFAFKRYGIKVMEWIEKVKERGMVVVDEVDMMMDERFHGCQETYIRLFKRDEKWKVVGLSATPDKIFDCVSKDSRVKGNKIKLYELEEKERNEHHIKIIGVKSMSGNMVGFVGPNRMREIVDILKPKLPYKEGHVLMFMNNGEITKQPYITNCIFSEEN